MLLKMRRLSFGNFPPKESVTAEDFPDFSNIDTSISKEGPEPVINTPEETKPAEAPTPAEPAEEAPDFSNLNEDSPPVAAPVTDEEIPDFSNLNVQSSSDTANWEVNSPSTPSQVSGPVVTSGSSVHTGSSIVKGSETATSAVLRSSKRDSRAFVWLLTYASIITLICAFLIYLLYFRPPHSLESLPDLKPQTIRIPENAPMPAFHTLQLGETQRYGNLEITPLIVTREPLDFAEEGTSTAPVLKLALKMTNVSDDQAFVPMDYDLYTEMVKDRELDKYPRCPGDFPLQQFRFPGGGEKPHRVPGVSVFAISGRGAEGAVSGEGIATGRIHRNLPGYRSGRNRPADR